MAESKNKRYFIKDTSIDGIDSDLFNYADISKVLERILESNEPPYNIAIIGKWGLGKSSLINLVKNKLKSDTQAYHIQEINAWKYEKESLRRVFLKQLWQGISGKKLKSFQEIQQTFSNLINEAIKPESPAEKPKKRTVIKNFMYKYGLPALSVGLLTFAGLIVYKLIQAHTQEISIDSLFWWNVILSYLRNIATTLVLPLFIVLLTTLLNEYRKKEAKRFEFNFPLETADDYELFLENSIADKLKENPKLKIVTVIDDLDRLSLEKIVEALDSIKAFVNLPNCVFIVPFDDEILKSALEKQREMQFGHDCDVIESELILDKLFQFKIYLPPLLKYDIKEYTSKLVDREIRDFITDNRLEKNFDNIMRRIIIHSDVTTPRQVKKLINAFVNNYLIAREREESGRVEKGLLTGERGIEQVAKLSVLQADFNDFYDLLFKDLTYLTQFVDIAQSQCKQVDVPLDLRDYYIYCEDSTNTVFGVRPEHEPLLNFLISRAKYSADSIAPFLYLAQDSISIKTGDERQRRIFAALESGNESTLKTMLAEKPEIAEAIISYISDCTDAELPLQAAYPILSSVDGEYLVTLANTLIERSIESDVDIIELSKHLLASDVLYVSQQAERAEHSLILIDNYLSAIANKDNGENIITGALKVFIPEYQSLSPNAQESIKTTTDICCSSSEVSIHSIIPLLDYANTAMFIKLWGVDWFKKLCSHISDENDYKADILDSLKKTFDVLITVDNAELSLIVKYAMPLFKLPPLLRTLDSMFSNELCGKLDKVQSTNIANELIAHDYEKNSNEIHPLLNKLEYSVDDENTDAMTEFTANYTISAAMDDVLVYLGINQYFSHIEPTILQFVNDIFTDEHNDELLGKISSYLTENARNELSSKLKAGTQYAANKNYSRELSIISVLASDDSYEDVFDELVANTLLSQNNERQNYYPQYGYLEFIAQSIGAIKRFVKQETIDRYVDKLSTLFPSQRARCLDAFERLSGGFSHERFAKVFPLLTTNVDDSDFEQALKILIDNDNVRPKDGDALIAYREFLVSHIETSTHPDKVLQTLRNSFKSFSGVNELVNNALNNASTNKNILIDTVVNCFNGYDTADRLADESLPMFSSAHNFALLQEAYHKQTSHSFDDIFNAIGKKLGTDSNIDTLVNIAVYASKHNLHSAKNLYLKVLELGLEYDNVKDKVVKIISVLSDIDKSLRDESKNEFNNVLHSAFIKTTSESIQSVITRITKSCGWTRVFKKMLSSNESKLEIYNKLAK